MKIVIAGGTGFVGQALAKHHLAKNNSISILSRDENKIKRIFGNQVTAISWDNLDTKQAELASAQLVINLAGEGIGDARWTEGRKSEILNSRIHPTHVLTDYLKKLGASSPAFFSASAVGIYGIQKPAEQGLPPALDEQTPLNFSESSDFLSFIAHQWEATTWPARDAGVRVINMRFGVVMGKHSPMLNKLKWPYLLGLGGRIGSGKQPISWVALTDLVNAIDFLINSASIHGPVNFVSPQCVTQETFAKALGETLHRPTLMTLPAPMLELILGQMAEELLLNGQHVVPKVLTEAGFQFQLADIQSALNSAFK